jgi:putative solute:sodium symporter small subunit
MLRICYGYLEDFIRKTREKPKSPETRSRPAGAAYPLRGATPVRFKRRAGSVPWREKRSMTMPDSKSNEEAHWNKTTRLMFTHLGIWFFFGYVIHMFVVPLNKIVIPILGFPLGFYMAAQGSLIVFVVILFLFARQQDEIDREHGYAEED